MEHGGKHSIGVFGKDIVSYRSIYLRPHGSVYRAGTVVPTCENHFKDKKMFCF